MQKTAKTSRFLIDFFSNRGFADLESVVSNSGSLHQIIVSRIAHAANSLQSLNEFAQGLIQFAEYAYSLQYADPLQEVSLILMNLPVAGAMQVGKYYQALAIRQKGKISEALSLLEKVADNGPLVYRARAIQALGAINHRQGHFDNALRFYDEALHVSLPNNQRDLLTTLTACLNISGIKSLNGDHQGALTDLEKLLPTVLVVSKQVPLYFYFYRANLAYELGQVGRVAEAEAALAIALASPFAPAHPEWSETRDEIAAKRLSASHSVVAIDRAPEAAASPDARPRRDAKPQRILALRWLEHEGKLISSIAFLLAVTAVIARRATALRATEFLCDSSQPRAPPALA